MTARPAAVRFDDVLRAAAHARAIVVRGRGAFDEDVVLQLAGERVIELVAEAVNAAVDELEEAYPKYPWHEPVGMRNIVAHEYWRTDLELVWTALAVDIPEVENMVRTLLDEPAGEDDAGETPEG